MSFGKRRYDKRQFIRRVPVDLWKAFIEHPLGFNTAELDVPFNVQQSVGRYWLSIERISYSIMKLAYVNHL